MQVSILNRIVEIASEEAELVDQTALFPSRLIKTMRQEKLLVFASHIDNPNLAWDEELEVCSALAGVCGTSALIIAMHYSTLQYLHICEELQPKCVNWQEIMMMQPLVASSTTEFGNGGNLSISNVSLVQTNEGFHASKKTPICSYLEYSDALFFLSSSFGSADGNGDISASLLLSDEYKAKRLSTWNAVGMRGTGSHAFEIQVMTKRNPIILNNARTSLRSHLSPITHVYWSKVWLGIIDAMVADRGAQSENFTQFENIKSRIVEIKYKINKLNDRAKNICFKNASFSMGDFYDFNKLKIFCSDEMSSLACDIFVLSGARNYANSNNDLWRKTRELLSSRFMIPNNRLDKSIENLHPLMEGKW